MRRARPLSVRLAALTLVLASVTIGCSEESQSKIEDAGESVATDLSRAGDQVEARAVAEAIRVDLRRRDTAEKQGLRSVVALRESVDEVVPKAPGDPQVTEIVDSNNDGKDDDGKVEVTVDSRSACLLVPDIGTNTEVRNGKC